MSGSSKSKRDLRLQLLALYLLFVISIFTIILLFYINASQRMRTDTTIADLSLARAIALELDETLLKAKDAAATFSRMPQVIRLDRSNIEILFKAGLAARRDIDQFYRLSPAGILLYHYPVNPVTASSPLLGQDFSAEAYFQAVRYTREHFFSSGHISSLTGHPVVTSAMPVFYQGRFDGIIAIDFKLAELTETIERIGLKLPHNNNELKIIIVDATGQVVAHSEMDKIDNLFHDLSTTLPGIDEVLSSREGSFIAKDRWGVEWLYSYTPIPGAGWGVIVQRPTRLAFASLDSLQRGLVIVLILFSLGALFFWLVLSRRLIDPLQKLVRYGAGVGQETVEAELDRETVLPISQRLDQIGLLTRTLLRGERSMRLRLLELITLNKTSAAVAASLDTQQVIDTILDQVQRLLQVRQCALLVLDEASQRLELRASRGLSQNYINQLDLTDATRKLPAYRAIRSGRPVQISDIEADPDFEPILPQARIEGYRSILVIPLAAPHIPPAALTIYRPDLHHFSQQEIHLAASFANHAAIALEHATLFSLTDAELQKRVRFLSALNQVGRTVSQSLVMDDILSNALAAVFEVMPVDACWIYLRRETESFLRLRAQQGVPPALLEQIQGQAVEMGRGLIGRVAKTRRPLRFNKIDLQHYQGERAADPILAQQEWQALAAAPLLAKDSLIGVVGMASRTDKVFTTAEVELLQAIGDQIAIAVVNARLYRRSREAATLEERNRVAREIHDTLAQGFTGILIQLQAAERLSLKQPQKALASLQEARDLARHSLQEARRSVMNLRPTILENLTLDQAIARQARRFEAESGLKTDFRLEGYPSPLHPEVEQNLYRITQEALTNVSKHARASQVSINLAFESRKVTLSITDDGIGLNGYNGKNGQNGRQNYDRPQTDGFGLVGIQERVNLMQGWVTFETLAAETPVNGTSGRMPDGTVNEARSNSGTRIKVVIPK